MNTSPQVNRSIGIPITIAAGIFVCLLSILCSLLWFTQWNPQPSPAGSGFQRVVTILANEGAIPEGTHLSSDFLIKNGNRDEYLFSVSGNPITEKGIEISLSSPEATPTIRFIEGFTNTKVLRVYGKTHSGKNLRTLLFELSSAQPMLLATFY